MWKRVCAWLMILLLTGLFALLPASFAADTTVEPFTLSFEFYDSLDLPESAPPGDAKPLNPLQLSKDQFITVAIRYSGLQQDGGLANDGFRCLAAALCYDASCFELQGFDEPEDDGPAVEWNDAEWSSANWVADAQYGYTVSASVQTIKTEEAAAEGETTGAAGEPSEERDIRRIYIQYIAEEYRDSWDILTDDSGYLGAFNFRVLKEIPENAGVKFTWDDLAVGLYEIGSLDSSISLRLADAATTDHFDAPKDVHVATGDGGDDPDPEGYSITGAVTSYNAKNPITYELYRMGGDGEYETDTAAYTGTAVEAETSGATSGVHTQNLKVDGLENGTYRLVLIKPAHMRFVVDNIVINNGDVDLTTLNDRLAPIVMATGDLNADNTTGVDDLNIVRGSGNWNKLLDTNDPDKLVSNVIADIDGDGTVGIDDLNLIRGASYWNKNINNFTVIL